MQTQTSPHQHLRSLEEETLSVLQRFGSKRNKKKSLISRRFDETSRMMNAERKSSRSLVGTVSKESIRTQESIRSRYAATKIQAIFRGHSVRESCKGDINKINPKAIGRIDPTEKSALRERSKLEASTRYFKDDGTATLHLRDSISNALKAKRFDSISSMLLHESQGPFLANGYSSEHQTLFRGYPSLFDSHDRSQLVSKINFGKVQKKKAGVVAGKALMENNMSTRDVKYAGFENNNDCDVVEDPLKASSRYERKALKPICFNCWSAKQGETCELHEGGNSGNASSHQNAPFCDYWGIDSLRKSYRSEDIEADRSTRLSRLRFAKDQRRRSAITEHQSHPLFQSLSAHILDVNYRARRNMHARQWFQSIVDGVKNGSIQGFFSEEISSNLRMQNTLANSNKVVSLTEEVAAQLPRPPSTGFDPYEKGVLHKMKELDSRGNLLENEIIRLPSPVPVRIFMPRIYATPPSMKVAMGSSQNVIDSKFPINVVTCGSFGIKACHSNQCIGGPSREIRLSQKIDTDFLPPYHGYSVMDYSIRTPKPTPESSIPESLMNVPAPHLDYVERPLEHALDHRRIPTIMIKTGIDPDDRHYYGKNRPEQTGDTEDRGFRTSEATSLPKLNANLDTTKFVPTDSVVTPNVPQVSPLISTRTDLNYPFCDTKPRETEITDLAHILKEQRKASPNKPQLFTVITKQQPGKFMQNCDPTLSLGRIRTIETRSFSFVQRRRIVMFRTKDDIPYWYDRRNGKTFWVRPLYDEELQPIVEGGVILGNHSNTFISDLIDTRSNSRKVVMSQYESEEDKCERFRASNASERPLGSPLHKAKICTKVGTPVTVKTISKGSALIKTEGSLEKKKRRERSKLVANYKSKSKEPLMVGGSKTEKNEQDETALMTINRDISSDLECSGDTKEMKLEALVSSITAALGNVVQKLGSEQDILKLGVGLGMSLGAQGILNLDECKQSPSINEESKTARCETECLAVMESIEADQMNRNDENNEHDTVDVGSVECYSDEYQENEPLEETRNINKGKSKVYDVKDSGILEVNNGGDEQTNEQCRYSECVEQDDSTSKERYGLFLDAIEARRVGGQVVEYINSAPNVPQSKPVGRVRPRSIGKDWHAMSFDPWSAGKDLLTIEFIPELLIQPSNAALYKDTFHSILLTSDVSALKSTGRTKDNEDEEKNMEMFGNMCRCVRHGNAFEFDLLLNEADWQVPISYTDDVGNTLLLVCCQNGNKKMVKSCLRKGSNINEHNCNGQTCLHFSFGYGFYELGDYLISKGADDSIMNADGCTCYEGLTIEDVAHI